MATISQQALEQLEDLLESQQTEIESLCDELAEITQENETLRAQLALLMADRSMDVSGI